MANKLTDINFADRFTVDYFQNDYTMEKENTSEARQPQVEVDNPVAEPLSGEAASSEPVPPEDPMEKLRAELQEAKDKYLRLAADFDNFRKRSAKERLELMQTAGKEVITALLDVLDDCDRAESQMGHTDNMRQLTEGVGLVFHKLRSLLQARGLKTMESIGKEFSIEFHEAITQLDVADTSSKGKVIEELQKGYFLHDKILRHAKVVVGK